MKFKTILKVLLCFFMIGSLSEVAYAVPLNSNTQMQFEGGSAGAAYCYSCNLANKVEVKVVDGHLQCANGHRVVRINKNYVNIAAEGYHHPSTRYVYCKECKSINVYGTNCDEGTGKHDFSNQSVVGCLSSSKNCECGNLVFITDTINSENLVLCGYGTGVSRDAFYTESNKYFASASSPKIYCKDAKVRYICLGCHEIVDGIFNNGKKFTENFNFVMCSTEVCSMEMRICVKLSEKCSLHNKAYYNYYDNDGQIVKYCGTCYKKDGTLIVEDEEGTRVDDFRETKLSATAFFNAGKKDAEKGKAAVDVKIGAIKHIQSLIMAIGALGGVIVILIYGIQWAIATPNKRQELKGSILPLTLGVSLLVLGPRLAVTIYNTLIPTSETTATTQINSMGGIVINTIQTIGYIVAVVMVLYIGIQWLMAENAQKRQELKGRMINLAIGAVLIAGGVTILGWIYDIASKDLDVTNSAYIEMTQDIVRKI